jgi:tetratricopeptide (TPR) repeat protein
MSAFEGFRIWDAQQSSQDPQAGRDAALKADAQNAHYVQGELHMQRHHYDKAIVAYTAAINSGMRDAHVLAERGSAYAHLSQYASAAADYARAVKENPNASWQWYNYARVKLGAGDFDGYRQVCADMREQFGKSGVPETAALLLLVITTIDQGVSADDLVRWGKQAAQARADWRRFQGYGLYRAGQYEAAIEVLKKSEKVLPPRGGDLLMRAMAEHRLDKKDDALATFKKAVKWIDDNKRFAAAGVVYWAWTEQVEVAQLHREAAKLLGVQEKD